MEKNFSTFFFVSSLALVETEHVNSDILMFVDTESKLGRPLPVVVIFEA